MPIHRSYWVPLTVAIVLKPDFGSVFPRAMQRAIGTVVGAVIGAGVLAVIPNGPPILVFIAGFAAMLPIAIRRNYGMFSTFITPVIVLPLDLLSRGDWSLVTARLADTLVGCAVVLIVGYALWPGTWQWRTRLGVRFADAVEQVSAYLARALGAEPEGRSAVRRHTYRMLSDLRTAFQQTLAEPPPASRHAAAWWPAIVALERVTDAVTAAAIHIESGRPPPGEREVDRLVAAMTDLATAVRGGRTPRRLPLPEGGTLAGVAAEIHTARSVVAGPSLEEPPAPHS
ncbi:MAG: FUSC family protein [Streptosporangiaceae bacterium]